MRSELLVFGSRSDQRTVQERIFDFVDRIPLLLLLLGDFLSMNSCYTWSRRHPYSCVLGASRWTSDVSSRGHLPRRERGMENLRSCGDGRGVTTRTGALRPYFFVPPNVYFPCAPTRASTLLDKAMPSLVMEWPIQMEDEAHEAEQRAARRPI